MPGPIAGFRYIHEAIRRESAALATEAATLGPASDDVAMHERVAWFARVVHLHTSGEEAGLFPALDQRAPHLAPLYLLDHREERERFDGLATILRELADPARGDALELRRRAHAEAAALAAHARLHSRKEDELLVPVVDGLFTAPEQGAMVGKMLAGFQPADLQRALPWIVTWIDAADRVSYMRELRRALPPDRYDGVARMVSAGVAPAIWEPVAAALAQDA